jgi:TRAP-type C4-dicarboxylate transport system permease small subunit
MRRAADAGAALGALCIAAMALFYTAEVVARYFFSSPLNWSGDISSYLLLACVFLVLPKVTTDAGHVAVSFVQERMGPATRRRYERVLSRLTGVFCLITAYFVAAESLRQFRESVLTSQATQVPKWWLSALACLGLAMAAIHFLFPRRTASSADEDTKR